MSLSATPTRRRLLFGALYFSEGAPIGFIWWALPTVMAAKGATVDRITAFVSLLVFPWALKFLWAPLIDAMRGPRWGHRAWILSAQFVMGITLLPMMFLDITNDMTIVFALLLVHAFAATVQDVAIDAWAIAVTPKVEHGRINAAMATGKYVGRWLFGAGLLIVWNHLSREVVFATLAASIWVTSLLVIFSEDIKEQGASLRVRFGQFGRSLRAAATHRNTWLGVMIALISGAGFEALGAMLGPMMVEAGHTTEAIGWWRTAWVGAMIAGAWLGGMVSDKLGHRRSVVAFLVLLTLFVAIVGLVQAYTGDINLLPWSVTLAYFGMGLFLATSYALFMDLTDPRIGGTQFSTFMGATNGCEAWAGAAGGRLAAGLGYAPAILIMAGVSLLSLPLLLLLGKGDETRSEAVSSPRDD